ncbi:hypothetical protein Q7P37_006594 [Cladosporium fusiforme]
MASLPQRLCFGRGPPASDRASRFLPQTTHIITTVLPASARVHHRPRPVQRVHPAHSVVACRHRRRHPPSALRPPRLDTHPPAACRTTRVLPLFAFHGTTSLAAPYTHNTQSPILIALSARTYPSPADTAPLCPPTRRHHRARVPRRNTSLADASTTQRASPPAPTHSATRRLRPSPPEQERTVPSMTT